MQRWDLLLEHKINVIHFQPTVLTQGSGPPNTNRNDPNATGSTHRGSPVKNYTKPIGDEMSTEL